MEKNFVVSIITYNPDIDVLEKCVGAVCTQADKIIIWDNNSANISEIKGLLEGFPNSEIEVWTQSDNLGIAYALNQIFSYAREKHIEWVLTLDQDSVIPDNMIEEYLAYADKPNIGIIGCRTPDRNTSETAFNGPKVELMHELITSGSFTNVDAWERIGGFDENLFIDSVDKDYCQNLLRHGYVLLRVNSVAMSHTIGNIREIRFFGKPILIYNHPPMRKYYQIRNMVYMDRKYRKAYTFFALRHFVIGIIKILIFEENKHEKIRACIRGFIDGLRIRIK